MTELESFKLLSIALAIGLLIGLERGWRTRELEEGMRVAGLRTYGMISLLGALSGILAQQINAYFMEFAFLGLASILLVAYSKGLDRFKDFSITGTVASMITFTLGALTVFGHIALAAASAVVITALLGFKPLLHSWMKKLEQEELDATLKLLLISVVVLPILPDRNYGPLAAVNPYQIWWMVVLIAGISYLGYFAVKIVGNQYGPILTGALGGLVSSTAVTLNLSRLSKQYPNMENVLAGGILTACATMFIRTLLLTSVMNPKLSLALLPALLIMSAFTYFTAFLLWRSGRGFRTDEEIKLENPFQLGMALKFGAFLVVIMWLSKLLNVYFGDMGNYFLAATSGMADVDPITLLMSQMSRDGTNLSVAAKTILIAVSVNSSVKGVLILTIGSQALALRVGVPLVGAVIAGLLITQ
ncbi:MAG: MgtC/SapB family protein [Methylobacter sp.]|uniref:MgtC/SapB family protein n=1 Tax=Methylobacter sp. TaxID=2051955 RepID=UPI0025F0CAA6|nr:MgtC/SapB family protein [Methylobacter sp.]MCK9620232.1 MgtC/SapB family protein [Methylobacter sp.]